MKQKSFYEKCYDLLRQVPKGKLTTYKALAEALGTKAYQAVGHAMHTNPYAYSAWGRVGGSHLKKSDLVPCHRVINSNGEVGGFASGTKNKIAMLKKEGITIKEGEIVNFQKYLYKF